MAGGTKLSPPNGGGNRVEGVGRRRATALAATPTPTDDGYRLSLLEGFRLVRRSQPIALPGTAERVLAFLALSERPVHRSYASGRLWPETQEERAAANLRSALWRIRREGERLVEVRGGYLSLGATVTVDVKEGASLAHRLADPSVPVEDLELERVELLGELLPNWYDEWTTSWRDRYQQLRVHALEALAARLLAKSRFQLAIEAALMAVAAQPLRESAHGAVIRAHLAEGNRGEAVLQYRACCRVLEEELGVEPSEELRELVAGLGVS